MAVSRFTCQTLRTFVPDVDVPYESAVVLPRVFTPRQCRRIVDLGLSLAPEEARVGSADAVEETATRRARIAWIEPGETTLWIFDKLAAAARRANRVYGFDLLGFTEDAQFTLYDRPGAFYDWHQDGLVGSLAVRKLSLVVQLSDPADYTGGELEIFGLRNEQDAQEAAAWQERAAALGSVVVFPAYEPHRVRRIRSGRRTSLVSWIGGPPFR
jgi:PKHD-type hydroxylase